ncbi:MAG: response regulator [Verrucomicrobiota bacterium]|nr:response regulator [Verrucomicrobiota bacterium]
MEGTKQNRVLVVDDHPAIRETMNDILKEEGFLPKLAADGEEALLLCQNQDFDFVLLDIQMPKMNGVEVMKKMKESRTNCPKFIFFTAYSSPELQEEANSLGAHAFLKKPIKVEKILNLIRLKRNISIQVFIKNDNLRISLTKLLEKNGYLLSTTSSYDDALIQIRQINYDCIIYDTDSPGIEQETIQNTIKSLNSDTVCLETNEDENLEEILKRISFHLEEKNPVLN